MNPYNMTFVETKKIPGTTCPSYPGKTFWITSDSVVRPWTTNDDVLLQAKLTNSLRGHGFNLAVAVGEGQQTIRMISSTLGALGMCMIDLKHGRFEKAARRLGIRGHVRPSRLHPEDISGRFLELRYGWVPLINDCYESARAFEVLTAPPRVTTVRVRRKRLFEEINTTDNVYFDHFRHHELFGSYSVKYTEDLSVARSLGLTNPSLLAWELLPYSFVLDWFIPFGTYLDNLSVLGNLKSETVYTRYQLTRSRAQIKSGAPASTKCAYKGATATLLFREVVRTVSSGVNVKFPGIFHWNKALSSGHIWNAIALAHQRFGSEATARRVFHMR